MALKETLPSQKYIIDSTKSLRSSYAKKVRRVRRIISGLLFLVGMLNLVSTIIPPFKDRLKLLEKFLPVSYVSSIAAVTVFLSITLIFLARAVRRGHKIAWYLSLGVIILAILTNTLRGFALEESVIYLILLILFVYYRKYFQTEPDLPSTRSAILALIGTLLAVILTSTLVIEGSVIYAHHHKKLLTYTISTKEALKATFERLIGIQTVRLPEDINQFIAPTLLTVSISLLIMVGVLLFRPVVDRRTHVHLQNRQKALELIKRYPQSTLDYFALRNDKNHFFYNNTLVAFGVFNGVCLVSPDPIGPSEESLVAWKAFRQYVDKHGWSLAVVGACEKWLDIYRTDGMGIIYMGDEALVKVNQFNLAGGHFKGLRQAYNRIAKYGYSARFYNPLEVSGDLKSQILNLMPKTRRGNHERGFSMTLGRIFDPFDTDLLLTVAFDKNEIPVAFCQFVPAINVNGYSLDLMRRDPSKEHPNGLIDFLLISTIYYLKEHNYEWLSLNFATWRAFLDENNQGGIMNSIKRYIIKQLSKSMQIESLFRFNAKYDPVWYPRYAAYDAFEHMLPGAIALAKAESFTDLPIIGRLFERNALQTNVNLTPQATKATID